MSSESSAEFRPNLDYTSEEKLVRKAALLTILNFGPATVEEIARRSRLDLETAKKVTADLVESKHMMASESGSVVGSWGLTLVPSRHKLVTGGKDLYTW